MTAAECLTQAKAAGDEYQRAINTFVDDFRRATPEDRRVLVADGPLVSGRLEGLVAAVVSALCRESGIEAPAWAGEVGSPENYLSRARSACLRAVHYNAARVHRYGHMPAPYQSLTLMLPSESTLEERDT